MGGLGRVTFANLEWADRLLLHGLGRIGISERLAEIGSIGRCVERVSSDWGTGEGRFSCYEGGIGRLVVPLRAFLRTMGLLLERR